MKVIVGLGNPERKYQGTRHNVGFVALSEFARKNGIDGPRRQKFDAEVIDSHLGSDRLLLVWPLTYMNRSGRAVGAIVDFYKLDLSDLLVVCDDFHLPLGTIRFRARGSAAGQKGMASILERLGTDEINRLRIGVGPLPEGRDAARFVLGRFVESELAPLENTMANVVDGLRSWVQRGIDVAMNRYN